MSQNSSTEVLEVAVYTVHDAEGFGPLQCNAHQDLVAMDGFVRGLALRGLNDPALRADVVLWSSVELARQAADGLPEDPRFEAFIAAINEVQHFAHFAHFAPVGVEALITSSVSTRSSQGRTWRVAWKIFSKTRRSARRST